MDIPTSASTVITCTKSEFAFYLGKAFAPVTALSPDQFSELSEVVDGLVRQSNQHRGTFTGYSAYLDCQFTVTPDAADVITIPAVTETQRTEARGAARATVRYVKDSLNIVLSDSERLTVQALDELSDRLKAAAGHLRIAHGER